MDQLRLNLEDYLNVRDSGLVYTTQEQLHSNPKVQKEIERTIKVFKKVISENEETT